MSAIGSSWLFLAPCSQSPAEALHAGCRDSGSVASFFGLPGGGITETKFQPENSDPSFSTPDRAAVESRTSQRETALSWCQPAAVNVTFFAQKLEIWWIGGTRIYCRERGTPHRRARV